MSGFSYSTYIEKIDVRSLIEKNITFQLQRSFDIPPEIKCICCSRQKPSHESLRLSNGTFVCGICFKELQTIKYPEIYQSRYENYLKTKEAIRLKYEEEFRVWSTRQEEYQKKVREQEAEEAEPQKTAKSLFSFLCLACGVGTISLLGTSIEGAIWCGIGAVFSYLMITIFSKNVDQIEKAAATKMKEWQQSNPEPLRKKDPPIPELKGFLEVGAELTAKDKKIIAVFDYWPGYPPYWDFLRGRVLERDRNRCQISGCPNRLALHIHHIKALSDGGGHQIENLITLCEYHHGLQPQGGHERIWGDIENTFFSMVRAHYRGNSVVRAHVRRKLLVRLEEIKEVIEYYGIACTTCGKKIDYIILNEQKNVVVAGCSICKEIYEVEQKLTEETCVALASQFKITRNKGAYDERFFGQEEYRTARYKKIEKVPKSKIEKKIRNNEQVRCPLCNSIMILRTAKRGPNIGSQFYGCSRYPECCGTRNIER